MTDLHKAEKRNAGSAGAETEDRRALADLRNRSEIAQLLYRLYAGLDDHRFDDLRGLLLDEVTAVTPGGLSTGVDAVIAQVLRNHAGIARLQHVATNLLIELDGDRASVRANVVVAFADATSRPERVFGTVSRFRVRRERHGWRIGRIEVGAPTWRVDAAEYPAQPA